ncbi:MAG: restriction endonuclease subunit S, partial [Candidatus Endonucleobacter bathymodioli]|nr:restriction endonuclease subunit S [Candidatus Endonucleobacter bathymodioli]
ILSTADEKIEAIAEQIQKHETLKKGLLQKLLREGIGHTEFKESELGSLPVGWEIVKLKEILTVKYGKSQKDVEDENGEYPILGTGGLMGYANSFLCDKPSVLIGRKGTIDKPQYKDTPFWTVDTLFYTDIKENVALAKYVYFKFLTIQWRTLNEASGVPSLSAPNIHAVKMQLPPLEEQKQIADILSTADEKLEVLSAKKEKFETLKKGLLQKLLSGEVRV